MNSFSDLDIMTIFYFYAKSFHAYLLRLNSEFFSEEYQAFFEILQAYYRSYGTVPPEKVFLSELDDGERNQALKIRSQVYQNLENVKTLSHQYIIDKLDQFAKKSFLKEFLLDSYDLYESKQYEKIINKVSQLNESIIDNDLGSEYHDKTFLEDRYNPENYRALYRTGFQQLDECFGGWHKKCFHVIAGPSNAGKTLWLINFAANLLLNKNQSGIKILYITLEISKEILGRRMDSCLLETPMQDIMNSSDPALQDMLNQSRNFRQNRFVIKEMPGYKTTPSDIEALIRNLDIVSDGELKPDVVFIDYMGLCRPTDMRRDAGLYEKGLLLAVEFRSIAQRYNLPIIAAAQTNRDSFEDRVGQNKISDSIGIAQTSDLMLTINRNDEMDLKKLVALYLAKSRFSQNNQTFMFKVLYDCMRADDIIGNPLNTTEESSQSN